MRLSILVPFAALAMACGDDPTSYGATSDLGIETRSDGSVVPPDGTCEPAPCIGGSFEVAEVTNETGAFDGLIGARVSIQLVVDESASGDDQLFPETTSRVRIVTARVSSDPPDLAALMGGPDAELHGQMLVRAGDAPLLTIFAARPRDEQPPMQIELICNEHGLSPAADGIPEFDDTTCAGSFGMRRYVDNTAPPTDAIGGSGQVQFVYD